MDRIIIEAHEYTLIPGEDIKTKERASELKRAYTQLGYDTEITLSTVSIRVTAKRVAEERKENDIR